MQPLLGLAVSVYSWKVGIEVARQPAKKPLVPGFPKDSAVILYKVRGAAEDFGLRPDPGM